VPVCVAGLDDRMSRGDLDPMAADHTDSAAGQSLNKAENQELTAQQSVQQKLSPAAQRALAEAAARRAEIDRRAAAMPNEQNGRKGLEPVRYGDWEIKGLASDF
jgi:hypothetical protein